MSPSLPNAAERGSVLIVVMWVSLGLVTLALYFGQAMVFEYRAADNGAAGLAAAQAVDGARRYVALALENLEESGTIPNYDEDTFESKNVAVGQAMFWLIGRGDSELESGTTPIFGLVDEASKLNLNTVTLEMLEALPGIPLDLAAAIIDWRDEDSDLSPNGAESEDYLLQDPPYYCKDSKFETVEELHLVRDCELGLLYGKDRNRNGILEAHEDEDEAWDEALRQEKDDLLLGNTVLESFGLLEYLTIYTREATVQTDGSPRINLRDPEQSQDLTQLFEETFGADRAGRISMPANPDSVLGFYLQSGLSIDEFAQVDAALMAFDPDNASFSEGLVNVNTAPAEVLACIPGIGEDYAELLVAYRTGKSREELKSVAWVNEVLDDTSAEAGPYITTHAYQFSADVAAVGHHGQGFRRELFVIDASEIDEEGAVTAKVLFRRDLSRLGWPLGSSIRKAIDATDSESVKTGESRFNDVV